MLTLALLAAAGGCPNGPILEAVSARLAGELRETVRARPGAHSAGVAHIRHDCGADCASVLVTRSWRPSARETWRLTRTGWQPAR